jgi:hypothetical protein
MVRSSAAPVDAEIFVLRRSKANLTIRRRDGRRNLWQRQSPELEDVTTGLHGYDLRSSGLRVARKAGHSAGHSRKALHQELIHTSLPGEGATISLS